MIMEEVKKFSENNSHFYIIPDYTTDNQGQKIAEVFGKERLLTGGSGILEHLAAQYREEYECQGENILPTWTEGRELHFQEAAVPPHADSAEPTRRIIRRLPFYPSEGLRGVQTTENIWNEILKIRIRNF